VTTALPARAWRAARRPAHLRHQGEIFADLVRFRRNARPAREARPRRSGRGTALIVSRTDFVYQLKLEGVLAKALELEGYRPVVLTAEGARWAEPYLRAVGVTDFVYPDDASDGETERRVREIVDGALAEEPTVQRLKAFTVDGAAVGQQTLSSVSRRFQRGRVRLTDPHVRAALREVLTESVRTLFTAERLLDRIDPEILLFNEKGYALHGPIFDVGLARGANVIQFVSTGIHWSDALLFKRYTHETRRLHPSSLSHQSWEAVRTLDWTPEREAELAAEFDLRYGGAVLNPDAGLQEGKRIKTPEEVRAQLGLDPARKTAVLFSHVLWDANLFYGDDLFEDQEEWLVESVRAMCDNPDVNWVVKLHPANMYKATGELNDEVAIREAVGNLPDHLTLVPPTTDINTYSFFSVADYGITVRGTVGMELPCFGIRALTAGTGRYSGFGFTDDSATPEEYLAKLRRIQDLPPPSQEEVLLGKRHAYALFRLRPLRFESYRARFATTERLKHPLAQNLEWRVGDGAAVEGAADLRRFGEWAADRSQLDYIALPT
jgi:hypothetical protein